MVNIDNDAAIHVYDREEIHEIGPMFDEVMTFFEGKTKGLRMSRRSDFTPSELMKYLPNMVLLELKLDENGDVEDIFCRVCGAHADIIYGEGTGTWLTKFGSPEMIEKIQTRCQLSVDKRREFAITAQVLSHNDQNIVFQALYIPLSEDNEIVDKIVVFLEIGKGVNLQDINY